MRHQIDDDRRGQNQHVVLALVDVDPVGVGQAEPPLAHARDLPAAAFEGVFVVEEVTRRLQIIGPRHVDGEPAAKQREQVLLHHRGGLPAG